MDGSLDSADSSSSDSPVNNAGQHLWRQATADARVQFFVMCVLNMCLRCRTRDTDTFEEIISF
jgi:hypothetical protein